jgi:hypothetical protein
MVNYYHTKIVKQGQEIPNRLVPPFYEGEEGGEENEP